MPTRTVADKPIASKSRSRTLLAAACLLAGVFGSPGAHAQEGYAADMKAGRAAYNQNDMATAQRHFDAALKGAENDRQKGSAVYALGVIAQKQNNLPEAKQRAEQALAINPQDKQAKGLLDEVNAAPAAAKKPAAKGLAKTPLAPGTKAAAAKSAAGAAPAAGAATAPASAPGETPPLPKSAKPASKPVPKPTAKPAAAPLATDATAKAAGVPAAGKKAPAAKAIPSTDPDVTPPATGSVPRKSGEVTPVPSPAVARTAAESTGAGLPPSTPSSAGPASATATPAMIATVEVPKPMATALAGPERVEPLPAAAPSLAVAAVAVPLTTGSISSPMMPNAQSPAPAPISLQTSSRTADAPPLPARARYVEMVCGVDYRQDGRQVARAFEITAGTAKGGGDQAEILAFDLACERVSGGGHVPRTVLRGNDADVVRTTLRRAQDGGWSYGHHRTLRQVRVRFEADTLTLVPSAAEVAVLRKKLAENPAQLEALPSDARQNFELAVAGEGFPEFRLVRDADGLSTAFELAAKSAKRFDDTVNAGQARP